VYFLYLVVLFYCDFICLILYMFELNKWRWRWRNLTSFAGHLFPVANSVILLKIMKNEALRGRVSRVTVRVGCRYSMQRCISR